MSAVGDGSGGKRFHPDRDAGGPSDPGAGRVAGAAAPLRQPRKAELAAAQRQIAAAQRDTRGLGIRRDRVEGFVLDTETGRYEGADGRKHKVPSGIALSLIGAASKDQDAAPVGRIRFFADSSSTGGAVWLVAAGRQRDVQVDWLSGRITLVDSPDARH